MNLNHGKYLGVDYGDKRTGLAECDISGLIAGGIGTAEINAAVGFADYVLLIELPKLAVQRILIFDRISGKGRCYNNVLIGQAGDIGSYFRNSWGHTVNIQLQSFAPFTEITGVIFGLNPHIVCTVS